MDIISYNKAASVQKDLNERVLTDVPANAVFTDTTYSKVSEFENDSGYLTQASVPEVSDMMKKGPDIPANADLNNYNENGFFHQNLASNIQSGFNYPSSKGGMLTVMVDGAMIYHEYRNYDGTGVFHRTKHDGTWDTQWHSVWDDQNMGSGSGLDADKLDGVHLEEITHSGSSVELTGDVTGTTTVSSTGGITLSTTVGNDSHNHSISTIDGLQSALNEKQSNLVSGTDIKTLSGESLLGSGNIALTKTSVGLGNVDNTSDLGKPVSTATQSALDTKSEKSQTSTTNTAYTDATTGLGYKLYVDNGTIFLEEI